jgi:hypothetical protein
VPGGPPPQQVRSVAGVGVEQPCDRGGEAQPPAGAVTRGRGARRRTGAVAGRAPRAR